MSSNRLHDFEEVESDGIVYLFRGDFGMLAALKNVSSSTAFEIYDNVAKGDVEAIKTTLIASVYSTKEGASKEIPLAEKDLLIEDLITKHGLQEMQILSSHVLTNAMIGSKKKKQPRKTPIGNQPDRQFINFPLEDFQKSCAIMGVYGDDFHSMDMDTYIVLKSAHCIKLGLSEEGEDPNKVTIDDLEQLKSDLGVR